MKPTITLFFLFFLCPLFLTSCFNQQDLPVVKASFSKADYDTPSNQVLLYLVNSNPSSLHQKLVPLVQQSGNRSQDILYTFLQDFPSTNDLPIIRIDRVIDEKEQTTFILSTDKSFQSSEDREIFEKALDLTMTRNTTHDNYQVIFNEISSIN